MIPGRIPAKLVLALACALGLLHVARGDEPPRPASKDQMFRPTVIVLRGQSQGSGTIIASVPGETLVLTAAHVLESGEPAFIEVHRQNLGLERRGSSDGWPKKFAAQVVAVDRAADVAVLKVGGLGALPFVARVELAEAEPERGSVVVSVGIDRGTNFTSWGTRVVDSAMIDLKKGGGERPFLLTDKPPEHGRSGGGLFRTDGTIVGVCTGRADIVNGRRIGIFASARSIRQILKKHDLEALIARSAARRSPAATAVEPARGNASIPPRPAPQPPPAGPPSPR